MKKSEIFIFSFITIILLIFSGIVYFGDYNISTGNSIFNLNNQKSIKVSIPKNIPVQTPCLSRTCSQNLEDIYNDLVKINGIPAFNYIYARYNGFTTITQKQALFKEAFSKYSFKTRLFKYAEYQPYENEKLFVQNVVQMIWVEENKIVPWSIKDYTKNEVNFIVYRYIPTDSYLPDYNVSNDDFYLNNKGISDINLFIKVPYMHNVTKQTNEEYLVNNGVSTVFYSARMMSEPYKVFPLSYSLGQGINDKKSILGTFSEFIEMNFFHSQIADHTCEKVDCSFDVYNKYNLCPLVNPPDTTCGYIFTIIPVEAYFKERVGGCQEPTQLLTAMLRSLNIPALDVIIGGHHVTYMATRTQLYVHGDILSMLTIYPSRYLIMTRNDISKWKMDTADAYSSYLNYLEKESTKQNGGEIIKLPDGTLITKYNFTNPDHFIYHNLDINRVNNSLYYLYCSHFGNQWLYFNDSLSYYQSKISGYMPFEDFLSDIFPDFFLRSRYLPIKTIDQYNAEAIKKYGNSNKYGLPNKGYKNV